MGSTIDGAPALAIVAAAGRGRRMDADKALLELGGRTVIEHVVDACALGGVGEVVVVRRHEAAALPAAVLGRVRVVSVPAGGEMIDSLRAGIGRSRAPVLVFPVDHALAGHEAVATVLAQPGLRESGIVLPLWQGRPGHPIALAPAVVREIFDPKIRSLRDVVAKDAARVRTVPVRSRWVHDDLDTPADLERARAHLLWSGLSPLEQMKAHRSRRAFRPDPIGEDQLARLVDAARHASTSAYIQACAAIAVRDPGRKEEAARLCSDQAHIRDAPVFLAICADLHRISACCREHGLEMNAGSFELFLQATVDAALFGQNLQLAAESEGLGACMIGAAREHPRELAELLGLPSHVYVLFGMVLGHPLDDPVPRGRMPLAGILHRECYDVGATKDVIAGAGEVMQLWARRTNELGRETEPVNEQRTWSDRMAWLWGRASGPKARAHLMAELRHLGFGLEEGV